MRNLALLLLALAVGCAVAPPPRHGGEPRRLDAATFEHPRDVTALAYSPDGKTLATGCEDGLVRFFETSTGALRRSVAWSGARVMQLTFSTDGIRLLVWDTAGTFRLYRTASFECLLEYKFPDPVGAAVPSPDLLEVAAIDRSGSVTRRELVTGRVLWARPAGPKVHSLAYSPSGDLLGASGAGHLDVFDRAGGRSVLACQWAVPAPGESSLAFSPRGDVIAVGDAHGTTLVDVPSGKRHEDFDAPEKTGLGVRSSGGSPVSLVFSPDGLGLVGVWPHGLASSSLLRETGLFDVKYSGVRAAVFSPDGRVLAVARDSLVELHDPATGRELPPAKRHRLPVSALALSPDGRTLLTGGKDGSVLAWDLTRTGSPRLLAEGETVSWVGFSSSGEVIGVQRPGSARLIDLSGKVIDVGEPIYSVGFSSDGRVAWMPFPHDPAELKGAEVHLLDLATGKALGSASFPWECPRLAVVPDRPWVVGWLGGPGPCEALLACGEGGPVASRRESSGPRFTLDRAPKVDAPLRGEPSVVAPATLVWVDCGTLWRSDLDTGECRPQEIEGADVNTAHAVSPDGKRVAFGGRGWLGVWDTASGAKIVELEGNPGTGFLLAFSGDGRRLAATTGDGAVLVWDLP